MTFLSTIILLCYLFLIISPSLFLISEAAHARKRPTTTSSSSSSSSNHPSTKYDRQITTINPNGRLLQVDYSNECTKRGQCCIFVNYKNELIISVIQRRKDKNDDLDNDDDYDNDRKRQNNHTTTNKNNKNSNISPMNLGMHRISDGILCKMTGLQGDGRLLTRHLQSVAHQLAWSEGIFSFSPILLQQSSSSSSSSSTMKIHNDDNYVKRVINVKQIAKVCGEVQHSLTIRKGARPLGVDAVFMGRKHSSSINSSTSHSNEIGLFHCSVGGIVKECDYCACGQNSNIALERLDTFINGEWKDYCKEMIDRNSNNNKQQIQRMIMRRLIQSLSDIVLHPERNIRDTRDGHGQVLSSSEEAVDIYVMMGNSKRRGGIQISFAASVTENEIDNVINMFQDEYFQQVVDIEE